MIIGITDIQKAWCIQPEHNTVVYYLGTSFFLSFIDVIRGAPATFRWAPGFGGLISGEGIS